MLDHLRARLDGVVGKQVLEPCLQLHRVKRGEAEVVEQLAVLGEIGQLAASDQHDHPHRRLTLAQEPRHHPGHVRTRIGGCVAAHDRSGPTAVGLRCSELVWAADRFPAIPREVERARQI